MRTPVPGEAGAALEPVRTELLRAAHADAQALRAEADREAADVLEAARAEERSILDEARRQGEAEGEAAGRAVLVQARRTARAGDLGARRAAYEQLRRLATARVRALRDTDGYRSLLHRLVLRARGLLGPDAEVTEHPDGGVVARAAGRYVDCTLDALAARALDRLGSEVEKLWVP
ncbi:V-type ATP synthase subunit E family protein [Streptomyces sp. NPDC021749]|uniref:V-type ATP synthase subunit E family protein n=1 Tax=Streptomyces sp. NPDC021749 TaxID=3154905 RepID=UPI0033EEF389